MIGTTSPGLRRQNTAGRAVKLMRSPESVLNDTIARVLEPDPKTVVTDPVVRSQPVICSASRRFNSHTYTPIARPRINRSTPAYAAVSGRSVLMPRGTSRRWRLRRAALPADLRASRRTYDTFTPTGQLTPVPPRPQ